MTKAMEAMIKARIQILLWPGWKGAFYGRLSKALELVETRQVPTMATDGTSLYFNPEYTLRLSEPERVGLIIHEALHCGLCHHVRMIDLPLMERNVCFDYPVNEKIVKDGFVIPGNLLLNPEYFGKSAEQLHPILYPRKPAAQEPETADTDPDAGDNGSGDGSSADQDAGDGSGDNDQNEAGPGASADQQEPGASDDGSSGPGESDGMAAQNAQEPQEGAAGSEDAGDGSNGSSGASTGNGAASGEQPATGQAGDGSSGSSASAGPATGASAGQPGNRQPDASADQDAGDGSGLPADIGADLGVGGVLPAPIKNEAEATAEKQKWERIVREAASLATARNAGRLPDIAGTLITEFQKARIDWRETLANFVDSGAEYRQTWKRTDRRFGGRNFIMPGRRKDGINKLIWLVDISGSMDHVAFDHVGAEIKSAFNEGRISTLIVIYTNTAVVRVDTFEAGDNLEFNPPVGGGTDFVAAMRYVAENYDDATAVIFFTDLYVDNYGQEPDCPMLWLQYGSKPNPVVPFGEILQLT